MFGVPSVFLYKPEASDHTQSTWRGTTGCMLQLLLSSAAVHLEQDHLTGAADM